MFALEITFEDAVSQPEMVLIRRPQALIGASDYAHVVVEDLKDIGLQLRVVREIGSSFRCKVSGPGKESASTFHDELYDREAQGTLGSVKLYFTSLDSDLLLKDSEPPDRAGLRVLKQACSRPSPKFPALSVGGANPMVVSFASDQPIYIGRSKQCGLRLDSPDISARHSRVGYENGEFWVEDLGSTNGTFVNQQQISGRVAVPPGVPIVLGREITISGISSEEQLGVARSETPATPLPASVEQAREFPVLVSVSEVARPARLVLQPGVTVNIGRDPSSELWIGAPHISRKHLAVTLSHSGELTVVDHSMNGTAHDRGLLHRGDRLKIGHEPSVLDFGGNVTVAICFNADDERSFVGSGGAPTTFRSPEPKRSAPQGRARRMLEETIMSPPTPYQGDGNGFIKFMRFYRSLNSTARMSIVLGVMLLGAVVAIVVMIIHGLLK